MIPCKILELIKIVIAEACCENVEECFDESLVAGHSAKKDRTY